MLMDVNSLERMFTEFSKFHEKKEAQKAFWQDKVAVKKAEKMFAEEDEVRKLIEIEKEFRDNEKDDLKVAVQAVKHEKELKREAHKNQIYSIEDQFLQKVQIISGELKKLQEVAPQVKGFEEFIDLFISKREKHRQFKKDIYVYK